MNSSLEELDQLACWTLSAKVGDEASVRESVSLNFEEVKSLGELFCEHFADKEEASFIYLGTCHRIEFYSYGFDPHELFLLWQKLRTPFRAQPRLLRGHVAAEHLIRVASSMDSEVVGETQITGQLRDATRRARERGHLRGRLSRVLDYAFRVAKTIRSQTDLGRGNSKCGHVAVDGLEDFLKTLAIKLPWWSVRAPWRYRA